MNSNLKERFNIFINNRRELLLDWFNKSDSNKTQICLCAPDTTPTEENITILDDYDDTLNKIENNEFGKCTICQGDIENEVLELDFTKEVCIDHLSEEEKILLEQDLKMAGKVQKLLLPQELPALDGFEISVFMESAGIVGGDYFDFFCNNDNHQGIVVGDVMGKGFSASMLMANIQASLRILGPEYNNMQDLVAKLNRLFNYNSKLISFITLFTAKLNTNTHTLEYCNAGHNPPILFNADNKSVHFLKPTGPAIGLIKDPIFTADQVNFLSGDLLLIYTDGLSELRNREDEEYGKERIISIIQDYHSKSASGFIEALKEDIKIFSSNKFTDDITVMVIKRE